MFIHTTCARDRKAI